MCEVDKGPEENKAGVGRGGRGGLSEKETFGQSQEGDEVLCCFSFVRSTGTFRPRCLSSGLESPFPFHPVVLLVLQVFILRNSHSQLCSVKQTGGGGEGGGTRLLFLG